ncbi:MAG: hypothetical protein ACRD68_13685, partial [Pyrinomonadaceae bacterium]
LVITVSVVTAFGVQGFRGAEAQGGAGQTADVTAGAARAHAAYAATGLPYHQTYVQRQQVRLGYWQQRVDQRKASWNPQMRNAFERSMNVIDEAVSESLGELERNPHDEVSEEMLNAALRDKMELLREFSEQ